MIVKSLLMDTVWDISTICSRIILVHTVVVSRVSPQEAGNGPKLYKLQPLKLAVSQ